MQHSCGCRFCNDTIFQRVMPTICVIRGLNYKNRMEFTNFSHKFNISNNSAPHIIAAVLVRICNPHA